MIDGKYGGDFLSAHPEQLIRENKFQHVPILTGFTRDEGTIWFIECELRKKQQASSSYLSRSERML